MPKKPDREKHLKPVESAEKIPEPEPAPPPEWAEKYPWADTSSFHTKTREEVTQTLSAKVPRDFHRKMEIIIQSGKHPELQTKTDITRDALLRELLLLACLDQNEEEVEALLRIKRLWKIEAMRATQLQYEAMVASLQQTLEVSRGEKTRRVALQQLSELVIEMDDGDTRDKARSLIEKYRSI